MLEAAKFGFGLGYLSTTTVMAVGQLLLGNPLSAAGVLVSSATLTNPVAMTCAAVGAIYFGWNALSEKERNGILSRLSLGLSLGAELIRSMIDFVVRTAKQLFSSRQLVEFKEYIKSQALLFGKSLYDVTGKVGDLVKGAVESIGELGGEAADATRDMVKGAYEAASSAATAGKATASRLGISLSESLDSGRLKTQRAFRTTRADHSEVIESAPAPDRSSPKPAIQPTKKPPRRAAAKKVPSAARKRATTRSKHTPP